MKDYKLDPVTISQYQSDGLGRIRLENDNLALEFIPELGGKMSKLISLDEDRQFLLESQLPGGHYKKASYGDDFEIFDTSGFDECFPTVSPSTINVEKERKSHSIEFPDHGELWSRPWQAHIDDSRLILSIDGVHADYQFEKIVELRQQSVNITYRLKNNDEFSLPFIWSSHPLLKLSPNSEILTAPIKEVMVNWASDESIGTFGDVIGWPQITVGEESKDFSKVPDKSFGVTAKLFSGPLSHGFAALYRADWDKTLSFEFDAKQVPYLGLWTCYGGWPNDGREKHFTLGLEPATGRPDALHEAISRGECPMVAAGESREWSLRLRVRRGRFDFNDFMNLNQ